MQSNFCLRTGSPSTDLPAWAKHVQRLLIQSPEKENRKRKPEATQSRQETLPFTTPAVGFGARCTAFCTKSQIDKTSNKKSSLWMQMKLLTSESDGKLHEATWSKPMFTDWVPNDLVTTCHNYTTNSKRGEKHPIKVQAKAWTAKGPGTRTANHCAWALQRSPLSLWSLLSLPWFDDVCPFRPAHVLMAPHVPRPGINFEKTSQMASAKKAKLHKMLRIC